MMPVLDGAATTPPRTIGVQESSLPALLLDPVEAPSLTRSSPHIIPFERFVVAFGHSPHRRELLALVERELQCLQSQGVVALCMLVGGSFVRDGRNPNDFDALVVYRLEQAAGIDALGLMAQRKPDGLDLRFVPGDVGPVPLMKMACFFHTLYQSRDRGGDQPSYLVLLAD